MTKIVRGIGANPSEKNLARLADRVFLSLWSYPNLFKSPGQELCDLLVICGDDVLIFSVKETLWATNKDFKVAWSRWYRHAIKASVSQIGGAERWLTEHHDRIFLDAACTEPLPLNLPPLERRRVHGIALALGATDACAEFYNEKPGYFPITPDVQGDGHTNDDPLQLPFGLGDVRPGKSFVHVFNESALDLLGRELDTMTDFTDYLTRRERIIRSSKLLDVSGEHDLLACYLCTGGPNDPHDFPTPADDQKVSIPAGTFDSLAEQPQYIAKRKADEVSYRWDWLIGHFAKDILEGIAVGADGGNADIQEAEEALRSMALEPRLTRRLLGQSFSQIFREAEVRGVDRFARVMLPQKRSADRSVGYIVLILACSQAKFDGDYDLYRRYRKAILEGYCLDVLDKFPDLKRAFAIGFDASPKVTAAREARKIL